MNVPKPPSGYRLLRNGESFDVGDMVYLSDHDNGTGSDRTRKWEKIKADWPVLSSGGGADLSFARKKMSR